jgi:hypothetical protein
VSLILAILAGSQTFAPNPGEVSLQEERKIVQNYARCVVGRRPEAAAEVVLSPSNNKTLVKNYPDMFFEGCVDGLTEALTFPGDLFRYAMANALVEREVARSAPIDPSIMPPLAHADPGLPPASTDARGRPLSKKRRDKAMARFAVAVAYSQVSRFGECVIRTDPAGSHRLLNTKITSDAEAAAIRALKRPLDGCLAKGEKMTLTKEVLRGTIALNYYRLLKSSRVLVGTVPHA